MEDCCASFSCEGRPLRSADATNQKKPAGIRAGAATATTAAEPREAGGTGLVARSEGSGGGAASCAVGAADGAARVGCGAGVAGSGGWNCPGTVVGDGGRRGAVGLCNQLQMARTPSQRLRSIAATSHAAVRGCTTLSHCVRAHTLYKHRCGLSTIDELELSEAVSRLSLLDEEPRTLF